MRNQIQSIEAKYGKQHARLILQSVAENLYASGVAGRESNNEVMTDFEIWAREQTTQQDEKDAK